jgi:hypothetical protein
MGWIKSKEDKQHTYDAYKNKGNLIIAAFSSFFFKQTVLKNKRHRGRNKENRDIDPVGRFSNNSVISVKEHGNKNQARQ